MRRGSQNIDWVAMAFSYPEFQGRSNEDVEDFLEKMEVACISNQIHDPAQMLRLLQICLKNDARVWSKAFEEELRAADPPARLSWDNLRHGLEVEFANTEDPHKVWQEVQGLVQREGESVDEYIRKFSLAWERMCKALAPQVPPPDMMKKDRFLAGLWENLRWRVELKKPRTYEDALDVAKSKEWKLRRMSQLGVESLPRRPDFQHADSLQGRMSGVHHEPMVPVTPQLVPAVVTTAVQDDGLRQDMRQMVDLMKNLSLNMLGNVGNNRGRVRFANQPGDEERPRNGAGQSNGRVWKQTPTCYNCGELGHISPQCDKPRRMGGDMYPLPRQVLNRSNDYGIEIKGERAGSSGLTQEEKGKTKVISVVTLEKAAKLEDPLVMPIGKRTTQDKEGGNGAGPSKKKGKSHEGEDVKAKRKRRARRKFHVSDFPLGDGQFSYDLKEDLTSRKAEVTFGQLIEMVPKLKRQWKRMVNPMEKEPKRGSVKVLAMDELPDICPIVDVWHRRKNLGQGYVDGGAQICVITHSCVEKMGLTVTGVSGFRIRLANHQKVKCLGVVKNLEMEAYDVKAVVDFHVMPAGLGAYPIILGRPWLRAVGAVQDWRHGTISLYGKTGSKKIYNMDTRKLLEEVSEDEDESSDEDYSTVSDEDSDSTTSSSDEDVDVAFLLMDKEIHGSGLVAFANEVEEESEGPYEVIEGLMQTKVELSKEQELMTQMVSGDLSAMEKEKYLHMLASFPDLFITSYEEIRGFKGEEMHIELKEGAKPVRQRIRRMGREQMEALREEVDKLLKAGFIVPVETTEWVSPVVVSPKKDGKWRICVDFKPLNAATKKNPYPLPFID